MTDQTFEATYEKAPFAELIRLGVLFAEWFACYRANSGNRNLPAKPALGR